MGTNVSTTYVTCPADPKQTLGIKLPFLVMIVKNMKKYFTFEVQVCRDGSVPGLESRLGLEENATGKARCLCAYI